MLTVQFFGEFCLAVWIYFWNGHSLKMSIAIERLKSSRCHYLHRYAVSFVWKWGLCKSSTDLNNFGTCLEFDRVLVRMGSQVRIWKTVEFEIGWSYDVWSLSFEFIGCIFLCTTLIRHQNFSTFKITILWSLVLTSISAEFLPLLPFRWNSNFYETFRSLLSAQFYRLLPSV